MVKRYFFNLLIAIDQFFNVLLGGYPDETISSRMGKHIIRNQDTCKVCRFICRILDLIDKDHCKKSIEYDEGNPI